jgi:cold shock CspA family protein
MRFDHVRGYGFIAPDSGDEDVFLHANDLIDEKHLIKPGVVVEFEVEEGARGLKASSVRIIEHASAAQASSTGTHTHPESSAGDPQDGFYDVLSRRKYLQEITETLLKADPTLTGAQILQIRREMAQLGQKYGWIEN